MNEQDVQDSRCQACNGIPFNEALPWWTYNENDECECEDGPYHPFESVGEDDSMKEYFQNA